MIRCSWFLVVGETDSFCIIYVRRNDGGKACRIVSGRDSAFCTNACGSCHGDTYWGNLWFPLNRLRLGRLLEGPRHIIRTSIWITCGREPSRMERFDFRVTLDRPGMLQLPAMCFGTNVMRLANAISKIFLVKFVRAFDLVPASFRMYATDAELYFMKQTIYSQSLYWRSWRTMLSVLSSSQ